MPEEAQYNMIMDIDFMKELGIDISFSNHIRQWNDATIPMKQKGILSNQETTNNVYQILTNTSTLIMSEDRHNKIIRLMYKEVDIHKYVISLNHISEDQ